MGLADTLILLGIRYDSDEAIGFGLQLGEFLRERAHQASQELAEEKGCFPNWEGSVWQTEHSRPMRNATCTTIAPTGSISIIAQCSSGIEPVFKYAYTRRALDGSEFIQLHPLLERLGMAQGWLTDGVKAELMNGADPKDIAKIPRNLSEVLVTAHDIAPEWHVHIQAALQANIDNAVSKTVNLPVSATVEEVDRVLRLAYQEGCKGITVYRDSRRPEQVLSAVRRPVVTAPVKTGPRPRPRTTTGTTSKFRMGCPDAIARAMQEAMGAADPDPISTVRETCEECGRPMRWEANCAVCDYCGDSKCA